MQAKSRDVPGHPKQYLKEVMEVSHMETNPKRIHSLIIHHSFTILEVFVKLCQ